MSDITPPPGAVLMGYGPEGRRSIGYRQRLHARALLLEDPSGERVALVTAELGAISVLVQRMVGARTADLGLGYDRIFIAATHTHAAPSHYFGLVYDLLSGDVDYGGFDRAWASELADRIVAAIRAAHAELAPARAGWSWYPLWGVTHNRAPIAYALNTPKWQPWREPPAQITGDERTIDPAWLVLRVDTRSRAGQYEPAGAFSVFALHGTGIPSVNQHYDSDLHGLVSKQIERELSAPGRRFVHLFANGNAGDATAMPMNTRCATPVAGPSIDPAEFISSLLSHDWVPFSADSAAACLARSKARMRVVAGLMTRAFLDRFAALPAGSTSLPVRRAFRTIEPAWEADFCPAPRGGYPTLAGPADGVTRYANAGISHVREGERNTAFTPLLTAACQRPKHIFRFQTFLQWGFLLPREAQLGVLRIGDQVLATLPIEVTTTAGGRIKDAIAAELGVRREQVGLLTLVNGYMNYLTTYEEYQAQRYEGSSTIYGPRSARGFQKQLVSLATSLPIDRASPAVPQDRFWINSQRQTTIAWPPDAGPEAVTRRVLSVRCADGAAELRWVDLWPGRLMRTLPELLRVEAVRADGGWQVAALDDDLDLEITAVAITNDGYEWSARYAPARLPALLRFHVHERAGAPALYQQVRCD